MFLILLTDHMPKIIYVYSLSPLLLMFQIPRTQPGTLQVFNKYLLNKIRILAMLFSLWGELFFLFLPFLGKFLLVFLAFGFQIPQKLLFPEPSLVPSVLCFHSTL